MSEILPPTRRPIAYSMNSRRGQHWQRREFNPETHRCTRNGRLSREHSSQRGRDFETLPSAALTKQRLRQPLRLRLRPCIAAFIFRSACGKRPAPDAVTEAAKQPGPPCHFRHSERVKRSVDLFTRREYALPRNGPPLLGESRGDVSPLNNSAAAKCAEAGMESPARKRGRKGASVWVLRTAYQVYVRVAQRGGGRSCAQRILGMQRKGI
ncbi:hypothetical protein SKAU_G00348860 [Synaphobranchus kaupii]|uniref:Uncharacterized protein n=1 Tax=Synaphobranchus kaupii TaxID=118154 RepID=A0A9Q1EK39_SYNKA|nr:hypothetical protein SKAU_G00348860 [Synaphobranchus kaupii]